MASIAPGDPTPTPVPTPPVRKTISAPTPASVVRTNAQRFRKEVCPPSFCGHTPYLSIRAKALRRVESAQPFLNFCAFFRKIIINPSNVLSPELMRFPDGPRIVEIMVLKHLDLTCVSVALGHQLMKFYVMIPEATRSGNDFGHKISTHSRHQPVRYIEKITRKAGLSELCSGGPSLVVLDIKFRKIKGRADRPKLSSLEKVSPNVHTSGSNTPGMRVRSVCSESILHKRCVMEVFPRQCRKPLGQGPRDTQAPERNII